jgi:hypothetical protein
MATPQSLNEAFIRELPDNGPAVMVNLVRVRERSRDGNGRARMPIRAAARATAAIE